MTRFFSTKILMLIALLLCPKVAYADIQSIRSSDSAVWAAAGSTFYNYKEPATVPDLPDSEHGWLPSGAVGVNYMTEDNLYFGVESSLAYGDADYKGSFFFFPTIPVRGTTRETISETDAKIGQGVALGSMTILTPYLELGFRYWDRDLGSDQTEDYHNFDALGGGMIQVSPMNRLVLTASGAAGTTFGAKARAAPDTFHLGSDFMYKIGGKVGFDVTNRLEVFTTVDYDHFNYGASQIVDNAFEPNSTTGETSARIGLAYHFK